MEFEFGDFDSNLREPSRPSSQTSYARRRRRESEDDSSTVSSRRIAVEGAGKNAMDVLDAGSFQMLRDECLDLCSTVLSREEKGEKKSLNAAVDLALLLSNKKTRSILLQNDTRQDSDDFDSNADGGSSVLNSILSVLAASHGQKKTRSTIKSGHPSRNRNRNRTKSARRKQKQRSQSDSVSALGSSQQTMPVSPDMKKVLASIFYFISWDCTLSKEYSIAVMGVKAKPVVARNIRTAVLQKGDTLQGAARLLLGKERLSVANSISPQSISSSTIESPSPNSQQHQITNRLSSISPSSAASTISSVSFEEPQQLIPIKTSRKLGDPTAAGRRKRRKRRLMQSIAEDDSMGNPDEHDISSKQILPPPKLNCTNSDFSFTADSDTFATPKAPIRISQPIPKSADESTILSVAISENPKLLKLLSKIELLSEFNPDHCQQQEQWLSMIFLQSLNRVIEGKDLEGPSCMENEDEDGNDDDGSSSDQSDEESNPILVTNSLLYKSGILPILASAMSNSFQDVTTILMRDDALESSNDWKYRQEQMSILAPLIDGACLFCESNRRAFCEEDPFSFEERNQGLLFHIFLFIDQCSKRCKTPNAKMDAVLLMGLRMLTSLTHDNDVAGAQFTAWGVHGAAEKGSIRGLDILANLVFVLEGSGDEKKKSVLASQEEYHQRYDCIVFCLNTLANIVEVSDVRRLLTEIKVDAPGGEILWLEWLCQWLKIQTESFHDAIMDLGLKNGRSSSQGRELHKNEEDRLVAAGNGCVLLACLMTEPESIVEEPELTNTIRQLIVDQMPKNKNGGSTGVTMIVNTLKAFCNFYQLSLGDLSVAIVTPLKKLIRELQTREL